MKWIKKDASTTIEEVVERNVGMPISEFLNPKKDPFVTNLSDAANFIQSHKRDTPVTVMGDYDADGVTSSSIMYKILTALGFTDIRVRLPKRFSEGYGLSMAVIDETDRGLLITVDNGIVANEQVKAAKEKGLSVVIIDHHIGDENNLPIADVVVDPNAISGSEFSGYCGAGLCYRLAKELGVLTDEILTLAAIGTVTDVMELKHDNRNIVKEGLLAINEGRCADSVKALMSQLQLSHVTAQDIAFKIGPCINAAGRMLDDGAMYAYELLSDSYTPRARLFDLALKLVELNNMRKEESEKGVEMANLSIAEDCLYGDNPLVIYGTDGNEFHEGVVGIIAGKMAEQHRVPCFVLTETEGGILKGSARTYGGVDIKSLMDKCASFIEKYGGHEGAGGLSIKKENMASLRNALKDAMSNVTMKVAPDEDYYDLEITQDELPEFIEKVEPFAPFGEGNSPIRFKITDYRLFPKGGVFARTMGAKGNVLKLLGKNSDAITFDKGEKYQELGEPKLLTLYGTISHNFWNGTVSNQVELLDFDKEFERPKANGLAGLLKSKMTEI